MKIFANIGFEHLGEDIASEIIQTLVRLGDMKWNFRAVETKYIVLYSLPFIYLAFFKLLHHHPSRVFPFDYDFPTLKELDSSVQFYHFLVFSHNCLLYSASSTAKLNCGCKCMSSSWQCNALTNWNLLQDFSKVNWWAIMNNNVIFTLPDQQCLYFIVSYMKHHFMHYLHIKIPGWCSQAGYAINSDTKSGKLPLEPQALEEWGFSPWKTATLRVQLYMANSGVPPPKFVNFAGFLPNQSCQQPGLWLPLEPQTPHLQVILCLPTLA